MNTFVLETKLIIPPARPGLVARPRLMEKMQSVLNNGLTLISAPAGFGKTTLISEWIRQKNVPAAWLSLEEAENDSSQFWQYFISALQTLQPKVGETALPLLTSLQTLPIESFITVMINDMMKIGGDYVMALDDYHLIQSPSVHNGLTFLLEHLPPKMHLVLATRIDPPWPLSRYRGRGSLLEIGADDLRFTSEEAQKLLMELHAPELSSDRIAALNIRTEGWVAGLKMALLSLPSEKDADRFINSFTGSQRYIMDYLIEEVLQKQTPEIQDFLIQTSILEKLSGPLCDALTGNDNGRETLAKLDRENLFLAPLDSSREWYRYEHLFAEVLRHRLELDAEKEMVKTLHQRASLWFEKQKLQEDAIHHALAAQDWENAMRLISDPVIQALRWRTMTMYNWLRQIPEESIHTNPAAHWAYIWALESAGQYDTAETQLKYREQMPDQDTALPGRIASVRTALAVDKGDILRAEEYAKTALSLLSPTDSASRWAVSIYLGVTYMYQSRYHEAEPLMAEAYQFCRQTGYDTGAMLPLTWLGFIAFLKGDLILAEERLKEVAGHPELNPVAGAYAHVILFSLYYERNDPERAILENDKSFELARSSGGLGLLYPHLCLVRFRLAQKDIQGAKEALETADLLLTKNQGGWANIVPTHFDRAYAAFCHIALSLARQDSESAAKWLDKLAEYDISDWYSPHIVRRQLYLRNGKAAAQERLRAEYEKYHREGLYYVATIIRLCQSQLADTPEQAAVFMAEALARGKSMGVIRLFADEGSLLEPLLRKAISQGIEPEYARKLLHIIEMEKIRHYTGKGASSTSLAVNEALSERELEVLRLLAADVSNQQIASSLSVSLSTVKTHVHHILEKLAVKDRSQAVYRARELKLI